MSKLSGLEPKDTCTICGDEYGEGGIQGWFSVVMPVTFCEDCLNSLIDMCEQIQEGDFK